MKKDNKSFLPFLKYIFIPIAAGICILAGTTSLFALGCPHCDNLREDCLTPRSGGTGGSSGKWNDTVTPKRGWACTGAEDLGSGNSQQCKCVKGNRFDMFTSCPTEPSIYP